MQMSRLLRTVYILLDKKSVTAKELSEIFEVSQRTIYRDIEHLSAAGIPIYATKGRGGGISLLDSYVLNKSILSENEQLEILASLQSLKALDIGEIEPVLNKLATMFGKNNTAWIDVDFSRWGSSGEEKERFNRFRSAIINKKLVTFSYYGSNGKKSERSVEPLKLIFKGFAWYVYAFCRLKKDYRLFKVSRIQNLAVHVETFIRENPEVIDLDPTETNLKTIEVVLRVQRRMAFRVLDEMSHGQIEEMPDGNLHVTVQLPDQEWLYDYLLSFGNDVEVIEPKKVREGIKHTLEKYLVKYLK